MEQKPYQGWAILVDADGTLTDGKKHVNEKGEREWVSFHSRDSIACRMLIERGFHVIILTHFQASAITGRNTARLLVVLI
jgi:3-deoxy-D-manno-octulosonate 8-phosphate phosphatase KdsC-like HAD superfamily phosphatase